MESLLLLPLLAGIAWVCSIANNSTSTKSTLNPATNKIQHEIKLNCVLGEANKFILLVGPDQLVNLCLKGMSKCRMSSASAGLKYLTSGANTYSFESIANCPLNAPSISNLTIDGLYSQNNLVGIQAFIIVVIVPGRTTASLIDYSSQLHSEQILNSAPKPPLNTLGADVSYEVESGNMYFALCAPGQVLNFKFQENADNQFSYVQFLPSALRSWGVFPESDGKSYQYSFFCPPGRPVSGNGWCYFNDANGASKQQSAVIVIPYAGCPRPVVWKAHLTADPSCPFTYSNVPVGPAPNPEAVNQNQSTGIPHYGPIVNHKPSFTCSESSGAGKGSTTSHRTTYYGTGTTSGNTRSQGPDLGGSIGNIDYQINFETPRLEHTQSGSLTSSYRGQSNGGGSRRDPGSSIGIRTGGSSSNSNIPRRDSPFGGSRYTIGGGSGRSGGKSGGGGGRGGRRG